MQWYEASVPIEVYAQELESKPYAELVAENDMLAKVGTYVYPLVPESEVQAHPLTQRRAAVANEIYRRAVKLPDYVRQWHTSRTLLGGASGGALIGGLVGWFATERPVAGALVGAVAGMIAVTNETVKDIVGNIASRMVTW